MAVHSGLLRLSTPGQRRGRRHHRGRALGRCAPRASRPGSPPSSSPGRPPRSRRSSTSPAASPTCGRCWTASSPAAGDYHHNALNHDSNAHAHLRAAVIGPSESVPVVGGRARRSGTWQQIVLLDFDDRERAALGHGPGPRLDASRSGAPPDARAGEPLQFRARLVVRAALWSWSREPRYTGRPPRRPLLPGASLRRNPLPEPGATVFENSTACAPRPSHRPKCASRFDPPIRSRSRRT